jgi:hypothetical protein
MPTIPPEEVHILKKYILIDTARGDNTLRFRAVCFLEDLPQWIQCGEGEFDDVNVEQFDDHVKVMMTNGGNEQFTLYCRLVPELDVAGDDLQTIMFETGIPQFSFCSGCSEGVMKE